jgi:hypothetical protein
MLNVQAEWPFSTPAAIASPTITAGKATVIRAQQAGAGDHSTRGRA